MTKEDMQAIVADLVEELRDLPDQTEITTWQLMKVAGYDDLDDSTLDLIAIHNELREAARKAHITLDSSKHDGMIEGLPYNLDYIAKNKKAQVRCPHCGSKDTGRILYGLPAMSDELDEKLRAGKIHLGGYRVQEAEIDGQFVRIDPTRYCNSCKRKFGAPPIYFYRDAPRDYRADVVVFRYSDGGYFEGHTDLSVRKTPDGIVAVTEAFPLRNPDDPHSGTYPMSAREWDDFMDTIYTACRLHEWKKRYDDPGVLDGEQWEIEILLSGNRRRSYYGSNSFPPYWNDLQKAVNRIIRKCRQK